MQRICIGWNSIGAPWGCFRDSPTSAFIQSCQNDDTVSSESQWHLIVMRGNIRGSWREPVEVQDLSIDLVLSQNLNTHSFTQIGFLLIFYDEEIYNIQYSECFFKNQFVKQLVHLPGQSPLNRSLDRRSWIRCLRSGWSPLGHPDQRVWDF